MAYFPQTKEKAGSDTSPDRDAVVYGEDVAQNQALVRQLKGAFYSLTTPPAARRLEADPDYDAPAQRDTSL